MEYTPISPFMRPISHAHLRVIERPEASVPGKPVNKWELLRELSKAQAAFGVTERDLTVLQGLLSFFPDDALGGNAEMVIPGVGAATVTTGRRGKQLKLELKSEETEFVSWLEGNAPQLLAELHERWKRSED